MQTPGRTSNPTHRFGTRKETSCLGARQRPASCRHCWSRSPCPPLAPRTTVTLTIQDRDDDRLLEHAPGEPYIVIGRQQDFRPPRHGSIINFLQLSDSRGTAKRQRDRFRNEVLLRNTEADYGEAILRLRSTNGDSLCNRLVQKPLKGLCGEFCGLALEIRLLGQSGA
jgi:hypothetical protein